MALQSSNFAPDFAKVADIKTSVVDRGTGRYHLRSGKGLAMSSNFSRFLGYLWRI